MPSWVPTTKEGDIMNGVSRFLTKRDRKSKGVGAEGKASRSGDQVSELDKVFAPEEHKKKTDKEEEKKVKAVTQRLQQLGYANLKDAHIEYALRAKSSEGDVDKTVDLLRVFEDSVEGVVREYDPKVHLVGSENREAVTCYLDALLFAMFARLDSFEALLYDSFSDPQRKMLVSLLRLWVNMLRSGKLITVDIVKHVQEALAACGWADATSIRQQDTSEAFTFITDKLQLPLLTLKMDIYHFGKEELKDDHRVVHERLLEVAIPEKDGGSVTLEECLENYFNNRIEVKRHLQRRNTLQSLRSYRVSQSEALKSDGSKSDAVHVETTELKSSRSNSPSSFTMSPIAMTPTAPPTFLSSRHRTDSIFSEKRVLIDEGRGRSRDDVSIQSPRPRASTVRKEVLMPAWQFFSLIPWYTDENPTSDAQVAAHFSTKRPVLGICLKRYQMLENGRSKRLNTHIDIPLEIALPEFVSDEHLHEDFGDFKLSLESIVCHRGTSTHAGHYISLVRGVPPRSPATQRPASANGHPVETPWMRFDDLAKERITMVDINTALKEESPYLLFYQVQPIDDDLPPSYAEAHGDSPPQHPIGNGQLPDSSQTDLSGSSILPSSDNTATLEPPLEPLSKTISAPAAAYPSPPSAGLTKPTIPLPINTDSEKAAPAPLESKTETTDFAASVPTTATQSTTDLDTSSTRGRDSLQLDRGTSRRPSVTFDAASLSAGTTPSAGGSVKNALSSTGPPTPVDEIPPNNTGGSGKDGSGNKGWLAGMTLGPRRESRGADKREPRAITTSAARSAADGMRASSTSAGDRLGLTMSRLTGKMSRDKLPASSTPATATVESQQQPEPVGASTVHVTETPASPVGVAIPAPDAQPRRLSLNLLAPPRLGTTAEQPAQHADVEKASAGIGRSRSLRHRHRIGMMGGGGEEKRRSKSRGRSGLIAEEKVGSGGMPSSAAAAAEGSGRASAEEGGGGIDGHFHPLAADGKKGAGHKPDRECAVM